MTVYKCLIADSTGKTRTVYKTGETENDVIRSISASGYLLLKIRQSDTAGYTTQSTRKNRKTVLDFTQMMELLIESGLSVKDSLEVAALIGSKNKTGKLASDLLSQIHKGVSFAKAIGNMPSVFPAVYRGIIAVGDKIGSVEKIFPRLRLYLESRKKLQDTISGALIYPCMVLSVVILGIGGLSIFVLPKLESLFAGFGGDAAEVLQLNMQRLQNGISAAGIVIAVLFLCILIFRGIAEKNKQLKIYLSRIILYIPFAGHFASAWHTLNFAFAMETLTSGGVTVEAAIPEAAAVVSNAAYKAALAAVTSDIIKGVPLSEAFSKHREFPSYMSQWLIVGERSGKTDRVFSQIRNYFQNETEQLSARCMVLVEPALIVIVGGLLLTLVITVIVPLFSLYGSIL